MHAVAYSLLSYLTAWLKVHYPAEFMAAVLTSKSDKIEKLGVVISDCNRMGIKVSTPDVNKSDINFTAIPKNNEILYGLGAIKGLGASVVNQIIDNRPYKNLHDFTDKVQDKTATIALIKAGAFHTDNKMRLMQQYARSLYDVKEYKPVVSLPTKAKLLLDWDINTDDYKVGKKVDKAAVLKVYNEKRQEIHEKNQQEKMKKHMLEFRDKYATDEFLWEFQSLSMFVTENPLQEAYDIIGTEWEDVKDGAKTVVPCVITNIQRKKDKNNNPFAYLELCTNKGIIEGTIWSKQFKEYSDLMKKGNCISILGRKQEGHLFVEKIKTYNQWLTDITKKRNRRRR